MVKNFFKTNISNKTSLFTFLIIISMIIWGGSWVSAKAIASSLPSEVLTFWRFFINFIALGMILLFFKKPVKVDKSAFIYIIFGALSHGLYLLLFFKGLKTGFAGASGVLVTTTTPLITFFLSIFIFKQKIEKKDIIGLILGFIGGCILLKIWTFDTDKIFVRGNIYFLTCALLWSILTICSQKAGSFTSPLLFGFFAYAFCTIFFFFLALPYGLLSVFYKGWYFWLNMFYLAIVSSAFATTIYFFAAAYLTSYKASSFVFLVPSTAVLLSWFFLGEKPEISTIAGGTAAIIAVYIINTGQEIY